MKKHFAAHRATAVQFAKFGTIGLFGFFVDVGLVAIGIHYLGLSRVMAGLFSFPFTVTFTWIGNRLFTFRHLKHERLGKQWAKFLIVCGVGLVFNRGTYSLMVSNVHLAYEYPPLGLLAGTAAGMFFNFFVSKKLVFR